MGGEGGIPVHPPVCNSAIVPFIDDCGDLSIVLCVRSFLYILESIIVSACAIFGGLRCNYNEKLDHMPSS